MLLAGWRLRIAAGEAASEQRLARQEQRVAVGLGPLVPGDRLDIDATAPRILVADALRVARVAAAMPPGTARDRLLRRADAALDDAIGHRAAYGEAWTVKAFVGTLAGGDANPVARDALARSYDDAPYLRAAGPWRVRYAAEQWNRLDPATRLHAIDEAVWLARRGEAEQGAMFALMRGSPAYWTFMARWFVYRRGDADYLAQGRPAP